jgi:hypothetical protein
MIGESHPISNSHTASKYDRVMRIAQAPYLSWLLYTSMHEAVRVYCHSCSVSCATEDSICGSTHHTTKHKAVSYAGMGNAKNIKCLLRHHPARQTAYNHYVVTPSRVTLKMK